MRAGRPGGRQWLAAMPDRVSAQHLLLDYLLDAAQADPVIRWIELGGSLARDAGDELSDIDAGLGIADAQWPAAITAITDVIHRAGPVADEFRQPFGGKDRLNGWHLVTLYASGLQLSLVVVPASWRAGLPPQSVALYDIDAVLARPWTPDAAVVTAETAREWACLAWLSLGDLAKYLERGSVWEARKRLEEARGLAWQLWALGIGAVYPAYGLTSVLDTPGHTVPAGMQATVAGLDAAGLRAAARALADVLDQVTPRALAAVAFDPPGGLRTWARARLGIAGQEEPG
jgi:hypothetical protein